MKVHRLLFIVFYLWNIIVKLRPTRFGATFFWTFILFSALKSVRLSQLAKCRSQFLSQTVRIDSTFSLRKNVYDFATTKLLLLPGLELGSNNFLPPNKMNF